MSRKSLPRPANLGKSAEELEFHLRLIDVYEAARAEICRQHGVELVVVDVAVVEVFVDVVVAVVVVAVVVDKDKKF